VYAQRCHTASFRVFCDNSSNVAITSLPATAQLGVQDNIL
jgi:hypothetical protein